jgi:hypothetical protein
MELTGNLPLSVMYICRPFGSQTACQGLPPESCAAFGEHSRTSLMTLDRCVHCPSTPVTIVKLVAAFVLLPLALVPDLHRTFTTSGPSLRSLAHHLSPPDHCLAGRVHARRLALPFLSSVDCHLGDAMT